MSHPYWRICPRCRKGIDDGGDGDCPRCARLDISKVHEHLNPIRVHLFIPFGRVGAAIGFRHESQQGFLHPVDAIHLSTERRPDLVGVWDRLVAVFYDVEKGELHVPFLMGEEFYTARGQISDAADVYQIPAVVLPRRLAVFASKPLIAAWALTGELT